MRRNAVATVLTLLVAVLLVACAAPPKMADPELKAVDLDRFAGRWYVLANVPYFAERDKIGSYVEYVRRADGRIDDLYFFRKKTLNAPLEQWTGIATVLDPPTNARLKASFIWPFSSTFWIAEVDADYQTALLISPDRKLAWIYSRTPTIAQAERERLKASLGALGVDLTTMVDIPQLAM